MMGSGAWALGQVLVESRFHRWLKGCMLVVEQSAEGLAQIVLVLGQGLLMLDLDRPPPWCRCVLGQWTMTLQQQMADPEQNRAGGCEWGCWLAQHMNAPAWCPQLAHAIQCDAQAAHPQV